MFWGHKFKGGLFIWVYQGTILSPSLSLFGCNSAAVTVLEIGPHCFSLSLSLSLSLQSLYSHDVAIPCCQCQQPVNSQSTKSFQLLCIWTQNAENALFAQFFFVSIHFIKSFTRMISFCMSPIVSLHISDLLYNLYMLVQTAQHTALLCKHLHLILKKKNKRKK